MFGPPTLLAATSRAHSRIAFCVATPLQDAVAVGFEQEARYNFFHEQRQSLLRKRTIVLDVLEELQVPHDRPQGAYFVLFDTSRLAIPPEQQHANEPRDWDVSRFFTATLGSVPRTAVPALPVPVRHR